MSLPTPSPELDSLVQRFPILPLYRSKYIYSRVCNYLSSFPATSPPLFSSSGEGCTSDGLASPTHLVLSRPENKNILYFVMREKGAKHARILQ